MSISVPFRCRCRPGKISRLLAAAAVLASTGCAATPSAADLRLVSAKARRDGDVYAVTAVVENRSPARFRLDEVGIEMTTYDAAGKVIARGYPFSFRGDVEPSASTRLPLNHPDRGGRVLASRLALRDARGNTLSEIAVPPLEGEEEPPAEGDPGAAGGDPFPLLRPDR